MSDRPTERVRRMVGAGVGLAAVLLGAAVCVGWFIESVPLVQIRPDLAPMKFNTALCILLLGISLILWAALRAALSQACAAVVLTIGVLTLFEHLAHTSIGLDTLFVRPFTDAHTRHAGRMSYYAATSLSVLAAAMLVQRALPGRNWLVTAGSLACALVMMLACAGLIGYATGHRVPTSGGTNMAFHTTLGFLALSWGVLATVCPRTNSQNAGLVNALLIIPILATSLGVTVSLWLLPGLSKGTSATAQPMGPMIAALAVTACLIAGSVVAARLGFRRAAVLNDANWRLKAEIAQREQIESAQRLLVSELDHRVRNTLSQVLALSDMTARVTHTVEQYHERFADRVRALSRAHSLLARSAGHTADVGEFLRAVLEPFTMNDGSQIMLEGPSMPVPRRATTALCVVFYELAANAAKHGALRSPTGRIAVSWRVVGADPGELEIEWRESGGPRILGTPESGFGTDLIRQMVPHELGGSTELTFAPEGVLCRVRLSLAADVDHAAA